ncbi:hypothetical protein JHS3_15770 [Jeongeupia sp. HS-3]|uniref:hypothetical protein n=1 Tax=Jeongeupia sp. HS-3 TaxID=1009682 RepID=UPI0018A58550|nr:hypothetical protein [Jeongeupia sp. HS-3]BCL75841.1 hypothetical protein JHS3_15770 [Jeongeupia sp. HS-3]
MKLTTLVALLMAGFATIPGGATAAETIFLPQQLASDEVEVLFVNRTDVTETFTPPGQLVCPGGLTCKIWSVPMQKDRGLSAKR